MEVLKETPLLKFNSNTLYEVRKELNLHQNSAIKEMIKSFEEWISKQNHFTKTDFKHSSNTILTLKKKEVILLSRDINLFTPEQHYLETSIISAKGSLERAKKTLDKLCTLKTLLPIFFSKYDVKKDLKDTSGFMIQATMPKLLPDNYRLYIIKIVSSNFDSEKFLDFLRFCILMAEYVKINDYAFGFTCIIDCGDLNLLNFVTKVNIVDLRHSMTVLMEGYGLRVKGIHILSSSKAVDALVTLLKQVLSAKIANRIYVHKTMDTLNKHISMEVLPVDYGGQEKSLKEVHENWVEVLSTEENVAFFEDMSQARTNENHRLTAKFNEQILGMPGSFRTLNVD